MVLQVGGEDAGDFMGASGFTTSAGRSSLRATSLASNSASTPSDCAARPATSSTSLVPRSPAALSTMREARRPCCGGSSGSRTAKITRWLRLKGEVRGGAAEALHEVRFGLRTGDDDQDIGKPLSQVIYGMQRGRTSGIPDSLRIVTLLSYLAEVGA